MAPSRVAAGGLAQSSSSSGIFFQGDRQSQNKINSQLKQTLGNSTNSVPRIGCSNLGQISGDVALNSVEQSAPSAGASSLVTDANSGFSGGPHFQRSASFNTESCMRPPASPMSFSSNNISITSPSVNDGSCIVQHGSHQDQNQQQYHQRGASSATSLPTFQTGYTSLPMTTNNMSQAQKKQRLDIKQEDTMREQVMQQALQRQDSLHFQGGQSLQLQAMLQQQNIQKQLQQNLQSMPRMNQSQLQQQQQQHQQQLQQHMQQQSMQQSLSGMKRPSDDGVCSRRLMQYLYHQRQRPPGNPIAYWRKFVAEYYSPRAKKRWCMSLYEQALGVFPQSAIDAWQCDICGSKSGRGFEAKFEILPRLNEVKFGSGVIDELLFLDCPRECRFSSGMMMLEYGKVVQESIYEQLRVVREGRLRIIFTQDLKILSWEFCALRHEELLARKLVAPQVNQMLQVAQKCLSTITESGSDGVSKKDLQTNSSMVLTAGRQLARTLELQSLNDLGFSKTYVRCLQISEVVNCMKDLMDLCSGNKTGPIEGLLNYPRHVSAAKLQMQKNSMNDNRPMINRGALSSAQTAVAMNNYQNLLRQNSINSNPNYLHQQEAPTSFINSIPRPSTSAYLGNQAMQNHMIQQLMQEIANNSGPGLHQRSISVQNTDNNKLGFGNNNSSVIAAASSPNMSEGLMGSTLSTTDSVKEATNSNSSAGDDNNGSNNKKQSELTQNLDSLDEMAQDIVSEFTADGFFNNDYADNMDYGWKA